MTEYEKADGTVKRIGTVSYNIYCNFTNYGSALQTWALYRAVRKIGSGKYQPVLVDYCPDALVGKDPLHPFDGMWDRDDESRVMCECSMPAIRENYAKFEQFYKEQFCRTCGKYTSQNFNEIEKENLAAKRGWKIAEISLRAANKDKPGRKMFYHAGVEEFLSLIRHAEFVVTNSFHGAVFGVQYKRPLRIWERELCSAKTQGLLKLTGLSLQMDMASESEEVIRDIYEKVHSKIDLFRKESFAFLKQILP